MLNGAMPGASRGLVKTRLSADAGLDLKIHDEVEISIPEGGFLRAAALLYAVPMMATLAADCLATALESRTSVGTGSWGRVVARFVPRTDE